MGCADVVLEIGFRYKIFPASVVSIEGREVRDVADIDFPADIALSIMSRADVHCEVGFFGESLGAVEVGARDGFALG